jgi:hypothetical protein
MHFRTATIVLVLAVALGLAAFRVHAVCCSLGKELIDKLGPVDFFS